MYKLVVDRSTKIVLFDRFACGEKAKIEDRSTRDQRAGGRENFVSFILLHLKAVIYARVEVKRNATGHRRERRTSSLAKEARG